MQNRSVAVVGVGRVGLPLALTFADCGFRVIGVEREQSVIDSVSDGRMPFHETGAQELLERVRPTGRLELTRSIADAAEADDIVLTLGTPAMAHIEIDLSAIKSVLDDLLPLLNERQSLILRSTVAP